jgi:putative aldouronate transport system permease protein
MGIDSLVFQPGAVMNTLKRTFMREGAYYALILPCVVVIFIFHYIPLYGLIIAFQRYNVVRGFASPWVGLANFRLVFSQAMFTRTIYNTLFIATFKIIGNIIVPVLFALLLNEINKVFVKRFFQTLVYLPYFLSWVIMAGVFIDMLALEGIINQAIGVFGIAPISFLSNPKVFPWVMIVTDIWKGFGFGTVVYLAAITNIDPGLYESALVDGAGRWMQTLRITIPLMAPTVVLMTVLSLGNILNAGFDQIYNLYSPIVYSTGDIIDTYVYRLGIIQAQYSIGTTVGLFKSVVSAILIGSSQFLANRFAGYRVF